MREEKRRAPRFRIDQMLEISIGREHVVRCRGVDLSEVGVLCQTDVELEVGNRVFVMLSLGSDTGDATVSCEGVVVRTGSTDAGFEAGIGFTDLDEASRRKLTAFLSRRAGG
jgi:hypothetical protein